MSSAFSAARERHQRSAQQQAYRRNEYQESRFVEVDIKKLAPAGKDRSKAKTYDFVLCCPPVPGKFPEIPLVYSRCRVELVRLPQPEIPKPKNPEQIKRMGFQQENEWMLNAVSYPEDEEKPEIIDAFFAQAEECGFLLEGKGFKHPNKAVQEAVTGLLPWTQYMVPCLFRGEKKVLSTYTKDDREYTNYTLVPSKDPDPANWTPVVLAFENENVLAQFFEKGDEFCADHERKVPWGRKRPAILRLKKGQKYEVSFHVLKGDIPIELYKELKENISDMEARMKAIMKTDEEIADSITNGWWWDRVIKKYPDMAKLFYDADSDDDEDEEAEEWDDDDDEPGDYDEEDDEDEEAEEEEEEEERPRKKSKKAVATPPKKKKKRRRDDDD